MRAKAILAFTLVLTALALTTTPALAARNHSLAKEFGSKGPGAGQLELVAPVKLLGGNGGDEKGGSGVAVDDATHDVYVADTGNHRVDEFEADGTFVRSFGSGVLQSPLFIAVDSSSGGKGAVYVGDTGDNTITKYSETGALEKAWGTNGQLVGPPGESFTILFGIAVAPVTGNLWVEGGTGGGATMYQFDQAGTYGVSWAAEAEPSGVAANGSDDLYVAEGAPDVRKFTASGEDLGKLFLPPSLNVTGLSVDPANEALYLDRETEVAVVSGSCPPPELECKVLESFGAGELAGGAGIAVNPAGAVVYVADTATDRVQQYVEEPPAPPLIASEFDSEVTGTSATLGGEIDPKSLSGEAETEYHFQYLTEASYLENLEAGREPFAGALGTPAGELAPSFDAGPVSGEISGLQPDETYHFRIVATNHCRPSDPSATCTSEGQREGGAEVVDTFTTQGTGSFVLPDGRQWEMVSPPVKHGALIEPLFQEGVIQAAADGDAITYHANQPFEAGAEGAMNQVQMLSTRGGVGGGQSAGWSTRDIEPPHVTSPSGKPEGEGEPYRFFSEDLDFALVQPAGAFEPALTPGEASETTPVLRTDYSGNAGESCIPSPDVHCYRPLVTGEEGFANVPPGTQFGEEETGGRRGTCPQAAIFCGPQLLGASPNGEHVVMSSYAQLTSMVVPGTELYEWSGGTLSLLSVMPGGEPVPTSGGAIFGNNDGRDARNAISQDGSRAIWSFEGAIYLREHATRPPSPIAQGSTAVDGEQCEVPTDACTVLVGNGEFQTANSEDTEIYFASGGDLYRYDLGAAEPARLTENAEVQGSIIGASETGEYVYFVGNGAIAPGAVTGTCKQEGNSGFVGQCNLYVEHGGLTKLVAVLSGADSPDWAKGGTNLTNLTARLSPDGQFLAFMSDRDLVGYDTVDALAGRPDEEVYLYDSLTNHLACASCEVTGARPHGSEYEVEYGNQEIRRNMPSVGGDEIWQKSSMLAATVPGWTPFKIERAVYQSRYLSDSGRLFFNSYDGLVPKDSNGNWDVYEYEPENVGSEHAKCGPEVADGSNVLKPERGFDVEGREGKEGAGCVGLISSGSSNEESAFLDASAGTGEGEHGEAGSEAGRDVFFLTTAKLAPQDSDQAFDIYDAHECTTQSPCTPVSAAAPRQCETEASCKAPPTPQPEIFGAPPSATFNGQGNLTPAPVVVKKVTKKTVKCKRNFVRKKVRKKEVCVKKPKKRKKR